MNTCVHVQNLILGHHYTLCHLVRSQLKRNHALLDCRQLLAIRPIHRTVKFKCAPEILLLFKKMLSRVWGCSYDNANHVQSLVLCKMCSTSLHVEAVCESVMHSSMKTISNLSLLITFSIRGLQEGKYLFLWIKRLSCIFIVSRCFVHSYEEIWTGNVLQFSKRDSGTQTAVH
jgi:hypothetical protein